MAQRHGVGIVLAFLTMALLVSAAGVAVTYLLVTREPGVASNALLSMRIRGDVAEIEPAGVVGQLFQAPPTVRTIADNLRKARDDDRVRAVVIRPGGARLSWGKLQELRDAVLDFRTSGKPVVAHLEHGSTADYYLAAASDRIYLLPTSPLDLSGLASYEMFLRGLLDSIEAYPDLMHIGDYKTAANTFTETGYTPAHREMAESLVQDLYEQLLRGIAAGRDLTVDQVRALVDQGPFLPEDALRAGLVDALLYEDQLEEQPEIGAGLEPVGGETYRRVSVRRPGLGRAERIAVIYAVGLIVSGSSAFDGPQGPLAGSDTLVEQIRAARDDESIRAIVLRVDSPGGSGIASDVIWRELMIAREAKPVIASMSDVAASGGYYIAMPAHAIVAQPGTLTGSIGVVMGKLAVGGTAARLGIGIEGVSRGRFAEMSSPARPYSPDERAKVQEHMTDFYDQFVAKAAEARATTPQHIDTIARGRVWTGLQARDLGLVDELGGLREALVLARQRAGIPEETDVELVIYPARRTLFELIRSPLGGAGGHLFPAWLPAAEQRTLGALAAPLRVFRSGEPIALMPYVFFR